MNDRQIWQTACIKQARSDWGAYRKACQIKVHFNQLLPIAYEIEILAPALSQDGPNPEYPWIDGNGQINSPCEFKFPLTKLLQSPQGIELLKHIKKCIEDFEKLFAL